MSELTDIENQRGHDYSKDELFEMLKTARKEAEELKEINANVSRLNQLAIDKIDELELKYLEVARELAYWQIGSSDEQVKALIKENKELREKPCPECAEADEMIFDCSGVNPNLLTPPEKNEEKTQ